MNLILAPAIKLMNMLSYRGKFLLISAVALLPLLSLSSITIWDARMSSRSVAHEKAGLEAMIRLRGVIAQELMLKGVAMLRPDEGQKLRSAVETGLADFDAMAKFESIAAARKELDAAWQETSKATEPETSFETHALVVDRLMALMQALVVESRLEADSDPAVVAAARWHGTLLTAAVRLAEIRDRGVLALLKQRLPSRANNALTVARSELDVVLDKLPTMREQIAGISASAGDALRAAEDQLQSGAISLGEATVTRLVNAVVLDTPAADFSRTADTPLRATLDLIERLEPLTATALEARLAASQGKVMLSLAMSLFALLAVGYLVSGAYASIRRSLNALQKTTDAVAGGDLTQRGSALTKDEVGIVVGHFNHMIDAFALLLNEVGQTSAALAQSSGGLTRSAEVLAIAAREQMEASQATATSVEQISASIQQVAENAQATEELARNTEESSADGVVQITQMSEQMGRLAERVALSVETIQSLDQRAQEISGIVHVIEGIAQQTNLLALNAAIEAARAGEQGRGFAVVADEVRKLAENTATSTKRIEGMVHAIQSDTLQATAIMRESHSEVTASVAMAENAAGLLVRIRDGARINREHVAEISLATHEQSAAAQSIEANISSIAAQTSATADQIGETARSAGYLDQLATDLRVSMGRFKVS